MTGIFRKVAVAALLASVSQPALAQSAEQNAARIDQLEARLDALAAQNQAQQDEIAALREQNQRYQAELAQRPVDAAPPPLASPPATLALAQAPAAGAPALTEVQIVDMNFATLGEMAEELVETQEYLPVVPDGGMGTPGRTEGTSVGITGNKDGSRVAIAFTSSTFNTQTGCVLRSDVVTSVDTPCARADSYSQNVTNLSLSAPAASSGDTSFATLDGLASGLKTELRHTIYFGDIPDPAQIYDSDVVTAARGRCLARNAAAPETCTPLSAVISDTYMTAAQQAELQRLIYDRTLAGSFGLSFNAAIGYDEYSYFPDTTFTADTVDRISYSAGLGAIYFPWAGSSLLVEGTWQSSFKAAKSRTRCRPLPDAGDDFLTCATGAFALPTREQRVILGTQFRQQIVRDGDGLLSNISIGPRLEFDTTSSDYAVDFPVYLIGNDSGMNAGIRFGYENEDDEGDFKIGIFYGTTFNLRPF